MSLLKVENLTTSFTTPQGKVQAVRDVSFELEEGEVLQGSRQLQQGTLYAGRGEQTPRGDEVPQ